MGTKEADVLVRHLPIVGGEEKDEEYPGATINMDLETYNEVVQVRREFGRWMASKRYRMRCLWVSVAAAMAIVALIYMRHAVFVLEAVTVVSARPSGPEIVEARVVRSHAVLCRPPGPAARFDDLEWCEYVTFEYFHAGSDRFRTATVRPLDGARGRGVGRFAPGDVVPLEVHPEPGDGPHAEEWEVMLRYAGDRGVFVVVTTCLLAMQVCASYAALSG